MQRTVMPLFLAASGTGVGKTFVGCLLASALRREGIGVYPLKPVMSGPEDDAASDAGRLLAACGRPVDRGGVAEISPWRFAAPVSPHLAAAREGQHIALGELVTWCATRMDAAKAAGGVSIIETAGGVMTPLNRREGMREWMAAQGLPVLLVCGSALGDISHGLAAHAALSARAIPLCGIVVSESAAPGASLGETAEAMARSGVPVFPLPRLLLDAKGKAAHAEADRVGDALLDWLRNSS